MKDIVLRALIGVEIRLKQSVQINYIVAKFYFLNFKGGEEDKTGFSVLTTMELNLPVEITESCKRRVPYYELINFTCTRC